jgi:hypothetical protein
MTVEVDIQVQDGKVIISVGGGASSTSGSAGALIGQGNVGDTKKTGKGGAGATDDPGTGGAGPASGTVVIGPIVVCCSALQGGTGASQSDGGHGGAGATDDPGTGGAAPPSGIVVIGPIVVCGPGGGSSSGAATSHAVDVNPE